MRAPSVAPPAPSALPTDPCPPPKWAGFYDHERTAGDGDADDYQGDGPEDGGDAPGDELVESQDDDPDDVQDSYEPDDEDDDQGDETDPDELTELPQLDEDLVSDEDQLAGAIDQVLVLDPAARAAQRLILEQQELVQDMVSPVAWAEVLRLDAMATARWADVTSVLVRWAWTEGRQVGREEA